MSFRRRSLAALSLAALCMAGAAAAQVIVLSAHGPSAAAYPQGTVLPANRLLSLKAGDQLQLLDGSGSRIVTGPGSVVAGHIDERSRARMLDLLLKAREVRPGIAATRGFEPPADQTPALWLLDLSTDGNVCVAEGQPAGLLWGDAARPPPRRLTVTVSGRAHLLDWPPGAESMRLPDDLPVSDGVTYSVSGGEDQPRTIVIRTLPATHESVDALAADLIAKGCYDQFDRLGWATSAQ